MVVTGAIITGPSSTFMQAAHVSAATAAAYRCLYAVPVLVILAAVERRRIGGRDRRERLLALTAGSFLGLDLVLWGHSIAGLGAGIATVVSNLQVFPVSLLGWVVLREKPGRRLLMAAPVAIMGMLLLAGAAGAGHGAPCSSSSTPPSRWLSRPWRSGNDRRPLSSRAA